MSYTRFPNSFVKPKRLGSIQALRPSRRAALRSPQAQYVSQGSEIGGFKPPHRPTGSTRQQLPCRPCASDSAVGSSHAADRYNEVMKEAMLNPYEYHPERGLYYHEISEGLLVGTQPRLPNDIDVLQHEAAVTTVLNLQEDRDLEYWGVNIWDLEQRCHELSVNLVRSPAKDFDPDSLRKMLPACCAEIDAALENNGRVYVHCTAGLGRSPAAAIAYLYWFRNMELDEAYEHLTSQRPCGPKRDSIRGATYDLMKGGSWETFSELPPHYYATLTVEERAHVQQCVRSCRNN